MTKTLFSKIGPLAVVVIIAAVSLGAAAFFYQRYQKVQRLLQNPNEAAKEENRVLAGRVGKLMDLPVGEDPTVATITDVNQLQDQLFFIKAKNGDKVLIYANAGKAILYRPSENKIIDVAPINIGAATGQPSPKVTAAPVAALVKAGLYNGTKTVGLTKIMEADLKSKLANFEVVARENASRLNYEKTLVVDLSGRRSELAQKIASLISGTVGNLPEGETKPVFENEPIEILVIAGNDYAAAKITPTPTPAEPTTSTPTPTPTPTPA